MNLFVADPHWGVWIVLYFFLGGIAAGAYFLATLLEWFGTPDDARTARAAHWVAFPLVLVCLVLLVVDLGRPERFWHMLVKSEVVEAAFREGFPSTGAGWEWALKAPLLKPWSPMSAGSWGLATCDACRTGIKTLSTLSMLPPLMLLVADAATLHLDLAAADRGYVGTGLP